MLYQRLFEDETPGPRKAMAQAIFALGDLAHVQGIPDASTALQGLVLALRDGRENEFADFAVDYSRRRLAGQRDRN